MDKKDYAEFKEMGVILEHHSDKLNEITEELKVMNTTLIRNTEQLEIHIKRTQQNEDAIANQSEKVDNRLKPIEEHVYKVNAYGKLAMTFLGLPAVVYYIIKIIKEVLIQ
jgi:hypothetical protein